MTDVFVTHRDPQGDAHCLEFEHEGEIDGETFELIAATVPDDNAVLDVTLIRD